MSKIRAYIAKTTFNEWLTLAIALITLAYTAG